MRIIPFCCHICAVLAGTLLCVFCSCKENPGGNGSGEPIDDTSPRYSLGDAFVYRWTMTIIDSTKDSVTYYSDADTALASVEAVNQKVDTLTGLVCMKSKLNHESAASRMWYRQISSSLTEVAYSSAGTLVLPKVHNRTSAELSAAAVTPWDVLPRSVRLWLKMKKMSADSVMKRDDPRVVYVYPLRTGNQWLSFSSPFPEYRSVVGMMDIVAGGRHYACAKIRTTLPTMDPAGDIEWYDYVSSAGLVLRTMSFRGTSTTESSPDSTGVMIAKERLELLSTSKN